MTKSKIKYIFAITCIFQVVLAINCHSQQLLRQGFSVVTQSILVQDSLTIVPSSISLTASSKSKYITDYQVIKNSISLSKSILTKYLGEKIHYSYRVLPFLLDSSYTNLDSSVMDVYDENQYIGYVRPRNTSSTNTNDLNYNGSFSRGFSVGNAQSLVLNSNFNLQLAGDLGEGIKIAAAISDDNIPIQPEGNTLRLQEFDKVFIKVTKDKSTILAGDFQLKKPEGYFTKYLKKLKGLSVENTSQLGEFSIRTDASIAVSRGKFARQDLDTKEGNQGPYKLSGNNGERFLIVLSGTEKVYLDGRLLKRGLDHDYVIDYNRAEITFTPTTLVRTEADFLVEFEYTDQSYLRTLYAINNYISNDRWSFNINFYSEQDSKNATGDILLDSIDVATLIDSGDDLNKAVRTGIFSSLDTTRTIGRVTYIRKPNPDISDSVTTILQYSDDFSLPLVTASFTEVGGGLGRYIIDAETSVNGRVYKYEGQGKGSYEPIIRLTPPAKKQMLSIGSSYKLKNMLIVGELSYSDTDKNRLSLKDQDDNRGYAMMLNYNHNIPISQRWKAMAKAKYEHTTNDYAPINPYREVEFSRNWNIPKVKNGGEDILNASMDLVQSDSLKLGYTYNQLEIQDKYSGRRHGIKGNWYTKYGLRTSSNIDLLSSNGFDENTNFLRWISSASQVIHSNSGTYIGINYERERNDRKSASAPTLLNELSKGFDLLDIYIKSELNKNLTYRVGYTNRSDYRPDNESLKRAIKAQEINLNTTWKPSKNHNLKLNFGYREFEITEPTLVADNIANKNTFIGKLDHNITLLDGGVLSSTTYSMNSGQQPKVEYFFERVPVGQGDYIYIGNEDSTQVNTNFRYNPELGTANYIKLSQVNGEFISTNTQSLAESIRIAPSKWWTDKNNLPLYKSIISRLSSFSTLRIDKKTTAQDDIGFLNFSRDDDGIVLYNAIISNTLYINKGRKEYAIQIQQRSISNKFTQISGLEERIEDQYSFKSRVRIGRTSDFIFELNTGNRMYRSELFDIRNYNIDFYDISPKLSYRFSGRLRFIADYTYDTRQQIDRNEESAKINEIGLDITYRQQSLLSITANIRYSSVDFNGNDNSLLEYDLLRGLKDGKNYTWNSSITRRLNETIDISFTYEGRKNGTSSAVHIARAQVKATF